MIATGGVVLCSNSGLLLAASAGGDSVGIVCCLVGVADTVGCHARLVLSVVGMSSGLEGVLVLGAGSSSSASATPNVNVNGLVYLGCYFCV